MNFADLKMGVWEWNPTLGTSHWDPIVYKIHDIPLTVPQEEVPTILASRMFDAEHKVMQQRVENALATAQDFFITYRLFDQNNTVHFIKCYGVRDPNNPQQIRGVCWDSTEEMQTVSEIQEARAKMVSSAKMAALGEMSASIAHEINNPLTVIQARAFQLLQMVEQGNTDAAKMKQVAESISRTTEKIAHIIKSMRGFARDGAADPFEIVSVHQIIEETLEFCKTRFLHHGLEVKVLPFAEDLEVECRQVQIQQVLLNLLNNSYDAVQNSTDFWIRIEAHEEDHHIEIHVVDSGPGIPAEIHEKIMQPFFTTKAPGQGTGLGLSISEEIMRAHQGKLSIKKDAPHTTLVLRLPRIQNSDL